MTLYQITFVVNLFALLTALWLGLYIVTRNPRPDGLAHGADALDGGLFFNILLALSRPPVPAFHPSGLQDWSVAPSVAFWHHATMLMRPGKMNAWR